MLHADQEHRFVMADQGGSPNNSSRRDRFATIPNLISALRLVVAIGLPFVQPNWRLPLLLAGAASDWLDGLLAKLLNSRSTFGQMLDPIADKALFLSALLTLIISGEIRWWQLCLVLLRDFTVLIVSVTAVIRRDWWAFGRMKPTVLGKITTVLVFAWLMAVLVSWRWVEPLETPLFIAACASSALTAVEYFRRFARELKSQGPLAA